MPMLDQERQGCASLPSRERGLKYADAGPGAPGMRVAPFTGAWIEIDGEILVGKYPVVAPFTGAWIEIR